MSQTGKRDSNDQKEVPSGKRVRVSSSSEMNDFFSEKFQDIQKSKEIVINYVKFFITEKRKEKKRKEEEKLKEEEKKKEEEKRKEEEKKRLKEKLKEKQENVKDLKKTIDSYEEKKEYLLEWIEHLEYVKKNPDKCIVEILSNYGSFTMKYPERFIDFKKDKIKKTSKDKDDLLFQCTKIIDRFNRILELIPELKSEKVEELKQLKLKIHKIKEKIAEM